MRVVPTDHILDTFNLFALIDVLNKIHISLGTGIYTGLRALDGKAERIHNVHDAVFRETLHHAHNFIFAT